jgi:rod shape determining protein RodA
LLDYRSLCRWSIVIYWVSIMLLIAVFFLGTKRSGAYRWISLGLFNIQPSELAKIAFIMLNAHFLSRPLEEMRQLKVFFQSLGLMVLPFLLILMEPDLGSAIVLAPTCLMMLYVGGAPRKFLLWLIGGGTAVAALFLVDILFAPPNWQIKLAEYQRQRLLVYFGRDFAPPNATPEEKRRADQLQREKSYQVRQAMISVGSGGLFGKGWCEGTQTTLGFLPRGAAHNDFIFAVIAEEMGFMGSATVLALYAAVLFSGIRIAGQARDRLGKLLAVGVVTLLFSHVFINIGMNIRLMPVTGVPLPLLSYGGSSVVCSLIALGILQNVHLHSKHY